MKIREICNNDLDELLILYTHLHNNPMPEKSEDLLMIWDKICNDENHHIIVVEENGQIISSCVCAIIPNLTHNQQPYALVENVITHPDYRNKGYGTKCLNHAKEIAIQNGCYKMMLLTGSKENSTLNFYKNAGYNSNDKTAFIQWI